MSQSPISSDGKLPISKDQITTQETANLSSQSALKTFKDPLEIYYDFFRTYIPESLTIYGIASDAQAVTDIHSFALRKIIDLIFGISETWIKVPFSNKPKYASQTFNRAHISALGDRLVMNFETLCNCYADLFEPLSLIDTNNASKLWGDSYENLRLAMKTSILAQVVPGEIRQIDHHKTAKVIRDLLVGYQEGELAVLYEVVKNKSQLNVLWDGVWADISELLEIAESLIEADLSRTLHPYKQPFANHQGITEKNRLLRDLKSLVYGEERKALEATMANILDVTFEATVMDTELLLKHAISQLDLSLKREGPIIKELRTFDLGSIAPVVDELVEKGSNGDDDVMMKLAQSSYCYPHMWARKVSNF